MNDQPGQVRRAARIFRPDNQDPFRHIKLKRECKAGNPYALAKLARLGLYYDRDMGAIVRREDTP